MVVIPGGVLAGKIPHAGNAERYHYKGMKHRRIKDCLKKLNLDLDLD